ncbi:EpsG family protein [Chryseobacterium sp. SIMBA_029]|uniref:EpsG family protein n=1 Tax=Chryseobacterium sp. SIMBA_029 TaxID=3085772 RepID=UPI00397C0DD1
MPYYLIPYIYIFFLWINYYFNKVDFQRKNLLLFVFLLPAFLIAVLRGNIGTDTFFYLGLFSLHEKGMVTDGYEPGFLLLTFLISKLGLGARFGVALISVITSFLLIKLFSRSKETIALFVVVFFPIFYFDFTMNGIRYGLSFALAAWAVHYLYEKKYLYTTILSVVAISIQYSALLIVLVFISNLIKKKYIFIFLGIFLVLMTLTSTFDFFLDHLAGKQKSYSHIQSPGAFSGIGPLIQFLFIYFCFLFYSDKKSSKKLLHIILILEIISFIIAKFTYAGLRLQTTFLFTLIIYILNNIDLLEIKNRSMFMFRMIIISLFSTAMFMKNITSVGDEEQLTPFLPYKFFWEQSYPF